MARLVQAVVRGQRGPAAWWTARSCARSRPRATSPTWRLAAAATRRSSSLLLARLGRPSALARWREITWTWGRRGQSSPGRGDRQRRPRQGPVRRPRWPTSSRITAPSRSTAAATCGWAAAAHGGGRGPVRRRVLHRFELAGRRGRHQRHRPAQLAGAERRSGTPSSGSRRAGAPRSPGSCRPPPSRRRRSRPRRSPRRRC